MSEGLGCLINQLPIFGILHYDKRKKCAQLILS